MRKKRSKKTDKSAKRQTSLLVKALYAISAVIIAVWIYMIVLNVLYIRSYAEGYGISVSSMLSDVVQYVITGTISYFVYGVLVFCAGKIIRLLQNKPAVAGTVTADPANDPASGLCIGPIDVTADPATDFADETASAAADVSTSADSGDIDVAADFNAVAAAADPVGADLETGESAASADSDHATGADEAVAAGTASDVTAADNADNDKIAGAKTDKNADD